MPLLRQRAVRLLRLFQRSGLLGKGRWARLAYLTHNSFQFNLDIQSTFVVLM